MIIYYFICFVKGECISLRLFLTDLWVELVNTMDKKLTITIIYGTYKKKVPWCIQLKIPIWRLDCNFFFCKLIFLVGNELFFIWIIVRYLIDNNAIKIFTWQYQYAKVYYSGNLIIKYFIVRWHGWWTS